MVIDVGGGGGGGCRSESIGAVASSICATSNVVVLRCCTVDPLAVSQHAL